MDQYLTRLDEEGSCRVEAKFADGTDATVCSFSSEEEAERRIADRRQERRRPRR